MSTIYHKGEKKKTSGTMYMWGLGDQKERKAGGTAV